MELSSAYSGGTSRTVSNQNGSVPIVHEGVVELKSSDGTALVRVGSALYPLKEGAGLAVGEKVLLSFSRSPDGSMLVEIAPKQDSTALLNAGAMTKGEYVAINSLSMLLGELEKNTDTAKAKNRDLESLKSLIRAFVKFTPSSIPAVYSESLPINTLPEKEKTVSAAGLPAAGIANAVQAEVKSLPQLRAVIEKLISNPEIPEKTKELLKTAISQIDKKALPVSVPQEGPLPVKVLPGVKLSVEVAEVRVDGRVSVSQRGGESFQVQLPVSVRQGDLLTFTPVTERAWTLEEHIPYEAVKKGESIPQIRQIVEKVLAEPQFSDYKRSVSAPELSHIEKAVESTVRAWNLPPEDADAMVRTLFKLAENHNVRDRIRPEAVSYAGVKNTGEVFAKIFAILTELTTNPKVAEKDKAALKPVLEQLKSFIAPVISESITPEKAVVALKKLEERSGVLFEHKLMRLFSAPPTERMQLLSSIKNDIKSQLASLAEIVSKSEFSPSIKEQISGETGKLLNQMDALQVRNSADQEWRHIYIPVVQEGEQRSAQVSFRRRGKKGAVDPENSSVVLRVAPSRIGEMEAAAKISEGRLFVKFNVQSEPLIDAFNFEKMLLADRLTALGYKVAGLEAGLWNLKIQKGKSEPNRTDIQGFDITA
ncbi:MAG: hypothetical protein JNL74_08475 [Fibrobacteres bacterium]|nr:hypothetical protein [Fibrobacterota bacterium]